MKTGDVYFLLGNGLIERVTFSKIRHVGIAYDDKTVFETDLWQRRAGFHSVKKYDGKKIEIWSVKALDPMKVRRLCEKYDKSPYSMLDIINNFWTAPFHPEIRKKIVGWLGNQKFMICSEITARIIFESTGLECLKGWESLEPVDLRNIFIENPEAFKRESDN